jgi:hypothetical protein
MSAATSTFPARRTDAFVHINNRAMVLSNGINTVMFPEGSLRYVADTLHILHEEGRATRKQTMATIIGGFRLPDGSVTLFAGPADRLVSLAMDAEAFDALRKTLDSAMLGS